MPLSVGLPKKDSHSGRTVGTIQAVDPPFRTPEDIQRIRVNHPHVRRNQGRGSGSDRSIRRVDSQNSSGELSRTASGIGSGGLSDSRSDAPLDSQLSGRSTAIETDTVSGTILAVPQVELGTVVYDYQLDADEGTDRRPLVLFDLENTGQKPLRWNPGRTRFLGTDDYTYQSATLSLDPDQFGPGCHTRSVTIEPGRRARVVTLVEDLPDGVEIEGIVHRLRGSDTGDGRIEITLA